MAIFSADGYFEHTPAWVKKVLIAVKTIIGTIAVSTYASGHEAFGFFTLIVGALLNELSEFIKDGPKPKPDQP